MPDDSLGSFCGLTGQRTREFSPSQLFDLYETYAGKALPKELKAKFFQKTVSEYTCDAQGVRWYSPALLGDGAYYETLVQNYDWYYCPDRWDKLITESWLQRVLPPLVVEVACGNGETLERIKRLGLRGVGVELSEKAVEICRGKGLAAYTLQEKDRVSDLGKVDALLMLQVVEHVADPVTFVRENVAQFAPDWVDYFRAVLRQPAGPYQ